ncbi:hypothetical protein [Acinetobacter indicus]|uniref:hypothetical protein n=1 Tax=Acinetobacter indicus TaxID=756892 RepID=UPI000CEC2337|nr:hypothetical protein [Acinetobacter indicus]
MNNKKFDLNNSPTLFGKAVDLIIIYFLICSFSSVSASIPAYNDKEEIAKIQKIVSTNKSDLESIKNYQKETLDSLNNKSINPTKEIGLPVLLSIIAGLIFWIIFQVLPDRRRKKKLRPKIENDLYNVSTSIYHLVELAFLHSENPVSHFHHDIRSGKVNQKDIELALFNKAKNHKHLVNQFSNNIVIGDLIYKSTTKIRLSIERIFFFNEQLAVEEILVLEDIYQEINRYDFFNKDDQFGSIIAGRLYTPLNPTLSVYSQFFYDMLKLAQRLDKIISSVKTNKLQILYIRHNLSYLLGDYKKSLKTIKMIEKKFPDQANTLKWLKFQNLYFENKSKSLLLLKELIKESDNLISYRGYLSNFLKDPQILDVLKHNTSEDKLTELFVCLESERLSREKLLNYNRMLMNSLENN